MPFLLDTQLNPNSIPKWLMNFVSTLLEVGNFSDKLCLVRSIDFVGSDANREG